MFDLGPEFITQMHDASNFIHVYSLRLHLHLHLKMLSQTLWICVCGSCESRFVDLRLWKLNYVCIAHHWKLAFHILDLGCGHEVGSTF